MTEDYSNKLGNCHGNKLLRDPKKREDSTKYLNYVTIFHITSSLSLREQGEGEIPSSKTKSRDNLFEASSFILYELESRRFTRELPFLILALPASFNSMASLSFSSATSGFAVPSFSSLNLSMYSNITVASSTLPIAS